MDEKIATEAPAIAPETVVPPTLTAGEDYQARIAQLEVEKENYRQAYLKADGKRKDAPVDEGEDDRMRRIAQETLADSRLAEIAREQDAII